MERARAARPDLRPGAVRSRFGVGGRSRQARQCAHTLLADRHAALLSTVGSRGCLSESRDAARSGLYEWARHGFGEFFGFLTGWNLWAYGIVCIPTILFMVPTELAYLVGPTGAWLLGSRLATTSLIGAVLLAISWIAARGLGAGKWLHNAGSGMVLTAYIILLLPRLEAALDELFSGIAGHHTTA